MSTLVTYTTVHANAISHARRARGTLLSYAMITGITVGRQSVQFQHPDYNIQVDRGTEEREERIRVPSLVAARLIPFANACFVKPGVDYDGFDFTSYVSGLQATPRHRAQNAAQLPSIKADTVEDMTLHLIGDSSGIVIHSFIGLKGQRALSVLGQRGTFGISHVPDLMRVYGGSILGKLG